MFVLLVERGEGMEEQLNLYLYLYLYIYILIYIYISRNLSSDFQMYHINNITNCDGNLKIQSSDPQE